MINEIKTICKARKSCQAAKVRRQHLSAAFEQAGKENLLEYDIDFYGHTHGDVLVALDLGTREVSLRFLPDRKMERVPLLFVNDEAKEFVDGLVHSVMNRYVGIMQITTGGIALDPTQTLNVSCSSI